MIGKIVRINDEIHTNKLGVVNSLLSHKSETSDQKDNIWVVDMMEGDGSISEKHLYEYKLTPVVKLTNEEDHEEVIWGILYEDTERDVEIFTDEESARKRFKQSKVSWSCILFKQVK